MDLEEGQKLEAQRFIREWHEVAEGVADEAWIPIPDFPGLGSGTTRANSESWCDKFYTGLADPHEVEGAQHFFVLAKDAAPDLIKHTFEIVEKLPEDEEAPPAAEGDDENLKKTPVTVVETRNWTILTVHEKLLERKQDEQLPALQEWLGKVLEEPIQGFDWPEALEEGCMLSTQASGHPMLLVQWHERADAGIRNGDLWALTFKRIPQLMGFSNPNMWFEEDFRKKPDGALLLAAQAEHDAAIEPFAACDEDWTEVLAQLLLGQGDVQSVMAEAWAEEDEVRERLHQAHCYIGLQALRAGDEEKAKEAFEACLKAMSSDDEDEDDLPASPISRLAEAKLQELAEEEEGDDDGEVTE